MTPMGYGVAAMSDKSSLEEGKTIITGEEALGRIRMISEERQNRIQGGGK